ncbi:SIMPL domain-containing protein [Paenibacillus segetis]|uniref:SIMPL domain-containing protein n=1 Tax=Paenibacillus segetis TaxID=1325360 RepID=A0ABQ1YRK9_9BACL|nr:SIMPL domain-containing protein [Paenibacillus segetis]GGH35686.1 SIMPL domain-containing protein [Paenibacillus segetis]
MKTWMKPVSAVLIAGTLLVGGTVMNGALGLSQPVYADSDVQKNVVNVTGTGEISIKPDVAYLSIGVQTEATTAKEAQSANAAKVAKLNTLLKDTWKIDKKDIQTGQFYVQPNYTYSEKEGQKVKGYTAVHTLQVTYRDLDKVGQLLDGASGAGANVINNITFDTEKRDQFEEQVIQKAMANASMKASAIAKAANRQIGVVMSVTQSSNSVGVYTQNYLMKEMATADSGASTQIEAGEIKVNTTVSVTYELK